VPARIQQLFNIPVELVTPPLDLTTAETDRADERAEPVEVAAVAVAGAAGAPYPQEVVATP
jgi:hypothetical protein